MKPTNGIIIQDGKLVMQCGSSAVPIRYTDKDGQEITAEQYQQAFAREHNQEQSDVNTRTTHPN